MKNKLPLEEGCKQIIEISRNNLGIMGVSTLPKR